MPAPILNPDASIDILWVLAHPDDESFGNAGTMLLAHDAGITTGLVCATRGEVGQIRDTRLATRDTLPAVREHELRRAMSLAKLTELRLLGFRDSGMAGTPENEDARAFVNVPFVEAVAHVVGHIRDLRPRVVVSFGPDGVYGHPDHIAIGAITDAAVIEAAREDQPGLGEPWQIEAYYHVASSREGIKESATHPDSPFHSMSAAELEGLGIPEKEITHWLDVSSKYPEKHAVLMQHLTQISRDNPTTVMENELARTRLGQETYARQDLPWNSNEHDPLTVLRDEFPGKSVASRGIREAEHE
jgi:LmbE family N-acetylglucosaminyl deacetylase